MSAEVEEVSDSANSNVCLSGAIMGHDPAVPMHSSSVESPQTVHHEETSDGSHSQASENISSSNEGEESVVSPADKAGCSSNDDTTSNDSTTPCQKKLQKISPKGNSVCKKKKCLAASIEESATDSSNEISSQSD